MDELFQLPKNDLKNTWTREAAKLMTVIAELEKELKGMKERNLKIEFIQKKNNQIQQLVEFYNASDLIITSYQMEIVIHRINNKTNSEIFKKC